jgi:L-lactate dehydrogenase (cytochrome)
MAYEAEQSRIAAGRDALPDVETILGIDEFQANTSIHSAYFQQAAESFLPPRVANYYSSASLDGISERNNRSCFHKCRLIPRIMRDVSSITPQTEIFGIPSALPIYISPSSNALLGHPLGEINLTRGAARTGIVQGISAAASIPLVEILEEKVKMDKEVGEMGMVYQVYLQSDRSKTEELVREAVEGGVQ